MCVCIYVYMIDIRTGIFQIFLSYISIHREYIFDEYFCVRFFPSCEIHSNSIV